VCDLGETRRLGENNPSPYGYAIEKETTTQWQFWWWVALKFFYTYVEWNSIKSQYYKNIFSSL
jgi:hypothetical protein